MIFDLCGRCRTPGYCEGFGCAKPGKTISFTDEEIAALRREFFPRMLVASVVSHRDSDTVARALYKLDPSILPAYRKFALERESPGR